MVELFKDLDNVRGIYKECHSDGMIYPPSFMRTGVGIQAILRFCLSSRRQATLRYNSEYTEHNFVNKGNRMKK